MRKTKVEKTNMKRKKKVRVRFAEFHISGVLRAWGCVGCGFVQPFSFFEWGELGGGGDDESACSRQNLGGVLCSRIIKNTESAWPQPQYSFSRICTCQKKSYSPFIPNQYPISCNDVERKNYTFQHFCLWINFFNEHAFPQEFFFYTLIFFPKNHKMKKFLLNL